ncbi:hypothetical protein LEP1GSC070_4065, partial [Leptospira santarosai str. AIM]
MEPNFFLIIYTVFLFCELYHLLLKIDLHLLLATTLSNSLIFA